VTACVQGAREGYWTARTELGHVLPPHSLDALLAAYSAEGRRLVDTARAVDLLVRSLRRNLQTPDASRLSQQDADRPGILMDPSMTALAATYSSPLA